MEATPGVHVLQVGLVLVAWAGRHSGVLGTTASDCSGCCLPQCLWFSKSFYVTWIT